MNTQTIERILRGYPVIVTSSDNMKLYKNGFCISNTRPHWERGKHWVVFYKPANGPLEFFDCLNNSPEDYGFEGVESCVKTTRRVQPIGAKNCGRLCTLYVKLRSAGYGIHRIEKWMYIHRATLAAQRCYWKRER